MDKFLLGLTFVSELRNLLPRLVSERLTSWVYKASPKKLAAKLNLSLEKSLLIKENLVKIDLEREVKRLSERKIRFITFDNPEYPEELKTIYDPPPFLFLKGKALSSAPKVAIVGARRCTSYGRAIAQELAEGLVAEGVAVVSGLARGIDSAAHRGALSGETVAVLGNGLDRVYPPENKFLYLEIEKKGTITTEYPLGTLPLSYHFPARNRLISGLSQGVVVVEASLKSGALITADFALEQGREVFVVPGSVKISQSQGCHQLLKAGAALVESAQDILDCLNISKKKKEVCHEELNPEEKKILGCIDYQPMHVDELIEKSGLSFAQVATSLTTLEVKGYLKQEPGCRYIRIRG